MREQPQDELAHRVGAGSHDILRANVVVHRLPNFSLNLVSVSSARSARAALRSFAQGAVKVVNFFICGGSRKFRRPHKRSDRVLYYILRRCRGILRTEVEFRGLKVLE